LGGVFAGTAIAVVVGSGAAHAETVDTPTNPAQAITSTVTGTLATVPSLSHTDVQRTVTRVVTSLVKTVGTVVTTVIDVPSVVSTIDKPLTGPAVLVRPKEAVRPIMAVTPAVAKKVNAGSASASLQPLLKIAKPKLNGNGVRSFAPDLSRGTTKRHTVKRIDEPTPVPANDGFIPGLPGNCGGQCNSTGGMSLLGDGAEFGAPIGHATISRVAVTMISAYVPSVQLSQPGVTPD
jgi:hypothetical protein